MNKEKLNNVIILNGIPSNLIEEAILILKPTDLQSRKKVEEYARLEGSDFIKDFIKKEERRINKKKRKIYVLSSIIPIIALLILSAVHIFN